MMKYGHMAGSWATCMVYTDGAEPKCNTWAFRAIPDPNCVRGWWSNSQLMGDLRIHTTYWCLEREEADEPRSFLVPRCS